MNFIDDLLSFCRVCT